MPGKQGKDDPKRVRKPQKAIVPHFKIVRQHMGERLINDYEHAVRRQAFEESQQVPLKDTCSPNFCRILQTRQRQRDPKHANNRRRQMTTAQVPQMAANGIDLSWGGKSQLSWDGKAGATSRLTSPRPPPATARPSRREFGPVPRGVCERRLWKASLAADKHLERQNPQVSGSHTARLSSAQDQTKPVATEPPKPNFANGCRQGPKLRRFKLNGKWEKTTFPQFLVDDGVNKYLTELSTGPKKPGCWVSRAQLRQELRCNQTHDPMIIHRQLMKGNVFARGVQQDFSSDFWLQFDMSDPDALQEFKHEIRQTVTAHKHKARTGVDIMK